MVESGEAKWGRRTMAQSAGTANIVARTGSGVLGSCLLKSQWVNCGGSVSKRVVEGEKCVYHAGDGNAEEGTHRGLVGGGVREGWAQGGYIYEMGPGGSEMVFRRAWWGE